MEAITLGLEAIAHLDLLNFLHISFEAKGHVEWFLLHTRSITSGAATFSSKYPSKSDIGIFFRSSLVLVFFVFVVFLYA